MRSEVLFGIYCACHLIMIIWQKNFILDSLRQDGNPSSMRIVGFMFSNCVCMHFMYNTFLKTSSETEYTYMLLSIGMLFGIIKFSQITGKKIEMNFNNNKKEKNDTNEQDS